jgi:hypothetical protein
MSKWFSAVVIAAMLWPAPVFAQTQSLVGAWDFRAVFQEIGCTISGEATITSTATSDVYDVALTAIETCGEVADAPVGQRCVARRVRDRVSIQCRIVQIDPGRDYLPDDFLLVVRDRTLMTGLLTANWNAPAVWRRRDSAPII